MPLGIGEPADHDRPGSALRAHPALAAQRLGLLERGLDVGDPDVEKDLPLVAIAAAHPAIDSTVRCAPIDEPVVARLGNRLGGRIADAELPAEQLAVVGPEPGGILSND